MATVRISGSWAEQLRSEFDAPYFGELIRFVREEYRIGTVYPPGRDIFRAFDCCPFEEVKVVVVGQDPYHGRGQANGLCFSVSPGTTYPPSLNNIFKELVQDTGVPWPVDGDLTRWANQGVLLLNALLTVREGSPGSHQNRGWETFTDAVIRVLAEQHESLVFFLWGAYAQRKGAMIDRTRHLVLEAPHPSPLSVYRGFSGSRHFTQANAYLMAKGKTPIAW